MIGTFDGCCKARLRFALSVVWISFFASLLGCASTTAVSESAIDLVAQPKFLMSSEIEKIDSIVIEDLTLNKPKDIKRFLQVCRNAKWGPFPGTTPSGRMDTIQFMAEGVEVQRLLYVGGWLKQTHADGGQFGTIHVDDGEWFVKNIDERLSQDESSESRL
ncbi:MAG: hypothetical protein WBD20_21260 [Pirellulaceae bacterium]